MERIRNVIVFLRGQLWTLPLILSVLALPLAYLVLASAPSIPDGWDAEELWWLYSGDASSARDLLSGQPAGLMTMFSLVVSVTFVILTLLAPSHLECPTFRKLLKAATRRRVTRAVPGIGRRGGSQPGE